MYSEEIVLTNRQRTPLSLINIFEDTFSLCEEIQECKNAEELRKVVSKPKYFHSRNPWIIVKDSDCMTRLQNTDILGNVRYLIVHKTKTGNVMLKDFPDQVLVMELLSRGYIVSKGV